MNNGLIILSPSLFAITFTLTILIEKALIPWLKKSCKQPIYEGGPAWHLSKSGTPTMGGLAFLISISISLSIAVIYLFITDGIDSSQNLLFCVLYAMCNALVGVVDDAIKLKRRENGGLTPTSKLIIQSALAILFLLMWGGASSTSTTLSFSFGDIDIGLLYYPLTFLILIGITNCANLTDGVDGLSSSVAIGIGISLFFVCAAAENPGGLVAVALLGGAVAFLIFNINPARVFMGDTGSLFFGALVASSGVLLNNPLLILVFGIVYVIEGGSVILQVVYYKATRKRLFKMAPIHHHLEKCGFEENKICLWGMVITLIAGVIAYCIYI